MAQITDLGSTSLTEEELSGPVSESTVDPVVTSSLDPVADPVVTSPAGVNWRKWRAWLIVLLMIALAVFATVRLVEGRRSSAAQFTLGTATLTAQAVAVETTEAGRVAGVDIVAGQKVTHGEVIGSMITTTMTAAGKPRQKMVELIAPATGIISNDPAPVGGMVGPGQPFAQMYDPSKLTLVSTIAVKNLSHVSIGMRATLKADGLTRPVSAVVERIVPLVAVQASSGQITASQNRLQVVLTPQRPSDVADLVPGIHFIGTIDTTTGSATAPDGLHLSS